MSSLPTRALGKNGPQVSALGFGLMGMSIAYGTALEDKDAFHLLDKSIDLGSTFWDTSNVYGNNEDILGRYFKARPGAREKVFLATKFGIELSSTGSRGRGDPEYVVECVNKSLARLGVSYIDLYYVHRIDKTVPIEVTMNALVQLKNEGKIRHIGLSEASSDTLRRAHAVHPIAAHQVEYSPFELIIEDQQTKNLETCRELGIAIVAYSPLGRGLLTGKLRSPDDFAADDFRRIVPRFSRENFHKNLEIVEALATVAKRHNGTPGQLALAWLLLQGADVIPIPGTTRVANLEENIGAVALSSKISAAELAELNKVIRAAVVLGERYPDGMIEQTLADTPPLKA